MSYGFTVYNDDGSVQISTDFINYYFVGKGTYTLPAALTTSSAVSIDTGVTHDVAAVACDTWHIQSSRVKTAPSTIVTISPDFGATRYGSSTPGAPAGTQFQYWLFRAYSSLTPSTTDVGLEVYNSAGQVAFSSRFPKIMRSLPPIPITYLPPKNHALPGVQYNLPSGREYAFISYGVFRRWYVEPGVRQEPFDFSYQHTMKRAPGTGFYLGLRNTRGGRNCYPADVYEGGIIPIDVTGY